MEKDQFLSLISNFDDFVQQQLQRKTFNQQKEPSEITNLDNYLLGMQKRLKLKPPSQEEKFNKMLGAMKNLKSFVSVKGFMQKLGTNKFLHNSKGKKVRQYTQIKQQYESARGGFYLKKVQDHLKKKKYKRQRSTPFISDIQEDPLNPSQYKTWMIETLQKINSRPQTMFRNFSEVQTFQKVPMEDCLLEQHKTQYKQQFKVINNIHQFSSQHYEQFAKISSLLTNRLRKLLKSNCASRSSKMNFKVQEPAISGLKMSYTQRTTAKTRQSMPVKRKELTRVKTAGHCRKQQVVWRQNMFNRFRLILQTQEQEQFDKE